MNLTEFYYSLSPLTNNVNKYTAYGIAFNTYRLCTGYDANRYSFDESLRRFLMTEGSCVAMPNFIIKNNNEKEVLGILFRSLANKQFRYYNESAFIPYGAGACVKPYSSPWVIVESALDSDFLRNFYPYVISTNGLSIPLHTMEFLKGTCSTLYCGFDNDNRGNEAFHNLCLNHSGAGFRIKRLRPPVRIEGGYFKDFGDVLEYLFIGDMFRYNNYVSSIKAELESIKLCI